MPSLEGLRWRVRSFARAASYERVPRLMSAVRRWWVVFKNPQATIVFQGPVYVGPGFRLQMPHGGEFIVGPNVEFRRGFLAEIGPEGRVEIGEGCYFTYDAIIGCSTTVTIGKRCGLGQNLYIVDGNHRYRDLDVPFLQQGYDFRPIVIADDVQIHSKVTVIASIAERAIIGANSVVTRDIPPFTVAVGAPAKVIEYYGPEGMAPDGWLASEPASEA